MPTRIGAFFAVSLLCGQAAIAQQSSSFWQALGRWAGVGYSYQGYHSCTATHACCTDPLHLQAIQGRCVCPRCGISESSPHCLPSVSGQPANPQLSGTPFEVLDWQPPAQYSPARQNLTPPVAPSSPSDRAPAARQPIGEPIQGELVPDAGASAAPPVPPAQLPPSNQTQQYDTSAPQGQSAISRPVPKRRGGSDSDKDSVASQSATHPSSQRSDSQSATHRSNAQSATQYPGQPAVPRQPDRWQVQGEPGSQPSAMPSDASKLKESHQSAAPTVSAPTQGEVSPAEHEPRQNGRDDLLKLKTGDPELDRLLGL